MRGWATEKDKPSMSAKSREGAEAMDYPIPIRISSILYITSSRVLWYKQKDEYTLPLLKNICCHMTGIQGNPHFNPCFSTLSLFTQEYAFIFYVLSKLSLPRLSSISTFYIRPALLGGGGVLIELTEVHDDIWGSCLSSLYWKPYTVHLLALEYAGSTPFKGSVLEALGYNTTTVTDLGL